MHLLPEMLHGRRSPPTPFNVVIMYEDFGTGTRAKKALDYVAEEIGNGFEFRHSLWRLDVLQDPKLDVLTAPALDYYVMHGMPISLNRSLRSRLRSFTEP